MKQLKTNIMKNINDIINELKSHPDYLGSDIMTKSYFREKLADENDGDLSEQNFQDFFNQYEPQLKKSVESFYKSIYNHGFYPYDEACESMREYK